MLTPICTELAPQAVGPYSQAIKCNGFLYLSGQLSLAPGTGNLIKGPIAVQVKQIMNNISAVLKEAGSDLSQVVKTTVYLKDMRDFDEMNQTYAEFFPGLKPARTTIQVAGLPKDADIEIEVIAACF